MQTPEQFTDYRCSDYFASARFRRGVWSESEQLWLIVPAGEVTECPQRHFLIIGSPGVDGIQFGYRSGHDGIWAHYPIEDDFVLLAPDVSTLIEGWLDGTIKV
jgi:hypothetical protein